MTGRDVGARGRAGLPRDLDASIGGDELVEYTMRNLGYVAVKEMRRLAAHPLRPAVVSPIAFSALLYWLHDRVVDRVADLVPRRASGRTRCCARARTRCAS